MSMRFGPVRQIGYVVRDIETAMDQWVCMGVGPWFYREKVPSAEFRYQGKPSTPPLLSFGFANSGDLQIELIAQLNDAPSLYIDTLQRQGEMAQHIAYWTLDRFDAHVKTMLELGYVEGHGGRMGVNRGRFAYFVHPRLPSAMMEISESTGGKAEFFEQIRLASINWDGREPVRRVASSV